MIAQITTHEEGAAYDVCNSTQKFYAFYHPSLHVGMTRTRYCSNYGMQDCSDCGGTTEIVDEIKDLDIHEKQHIIVENDGMFFVEPITGKRSTIYYMDANLDTTPAQAKKFSFPY